MSAKGDCQDFIQKRAMNTVFKIIISTLALMACMAALGTLASLLFDAMRGTRDEFGAVGIAALALLLVGQCRILWILVDSKQSSRPDEQDDSDSVPVHSGTTRHQRA